MSNYFYDAENRLIQVDGTLGTCSTGAAGCYFYDALGHRVEKQIGSTWISYLHDTDGKVVTQTYNSGAGWGPGYVYLGGQPLALYSNSTTYFMHEDHLGSTRLMTDINGNNYDSLDFLPFGDQIGGGTGTTHKFTGYERDDESNLDNAQARYYSSQMGRFMSPDPYNTGADPTNPQSWNMYSYVNNNPLTMTDPTGMSGCDGTSATAEDCAAAAASCLFADQPWDCFANDSMCGLNSLVISYCSSDGGGSFDVTIEIDLPPSSPPPAIPPGPGSANVPPGPIWPEGGPQIPPGLAGIWPSTFGSPCPTGTFGNPCITSFQSGEVAIPVGIGEGLAWLARLLWPVALSKSKVEDTPEAKRQYEQDLATCRQLQSPAARSRCYASAENRRFAINHSKPVPPLIVW